VGKQRSSLGPTVLADANAGHHSRAGECNFLNSSTLVMSSLCKKNLSHVPGTVLLDERSILSTFRGFFSSRDDESAEIVHEGYRLF
jgi:hypothetical protein